MEAIAGREYGVRPVSVPINYPTQGKADLHKVCLWGGEVIWGC